ncbi:MAG: response regulator, partial [Thermosipho sp. (in: Bacteria)]|nr:response regulator [Thermosipho sp. (in: thermotogales)]
MNFAIRQSLKIFITSILILMIAIICFYKLNYNNVLDYELEDSKIFAEKISKDINQNIIEKVEKVKIITTAPVITNALSKSNKYYQSLSKKKRDEEIQQKNNKWMSIKDQNNSFILDYTNNDVSKYLKNLQNNIKGEYGEIFLTNKYGALVASTSKLTTFAHGHKYWWQGAYNNGNGAVFLDDRGYDDSVDGYVLGVVVPIKKDNEIIGILKANLNILGLTNTIIVNAQIKDHEKLKLIRSGGLIVFEEGTEPLSKRISNDLQKKIQNRPNDSFVFETQGDKFIVGCYEINISSKMKGYNFGGNFESIDHKKGNNGESWLILDLNPFSNVNKQTARIISGLWIIGIILTVVFAINSFIIGKRTAKPLKELIKKTEQISKGDFNAKILLNRTDEIGLLASSFNQMTNYLKKSTTSIDKLNVEIRERKQAEEKIKEKSIELEKQFKKSEEQRIATLSVLSDLNETAKKLELEIAERKRSEQIQKVLYNISNAAITTENLDELIKRIQKELSAIIDTTNFYIALYDKKTDTLSLPFFKDEKDSFDSFPAGKTLTNYVIKTQKSLLATKEKIAELEKSGKVERFGENSEIWLGVPLKIEGKVTGVLAVQSYTDENAYSESDMEILEFVSHQISISIERKKAEEDLKLAFEKAQESDRLKSAFLANMSHEIRTPMNGILGFAELLKDPQLTGKEQKSYIKIIEKNGARMLNTINDIIDISKIEAGQVKVVKSEVSVNKTLKEQYEFFNPEAQSKGLELIYKPTLSDKEATIVTDKHKLEGILTNLIKNAIKFTKHGNITFGYSLKKEKNFEELEFYVKDTGIGIASERINAIFDRFIQADIEDTHVFQGSGLGLAISKSYVEMLGGNIHVSSKEGFGSTFIFTIPYIQKSTKYSSIENTKKKEQKTLLTDVSVIIAEDDETSQLFLKTIFRDKFRNIIYTTNGVETVEAIKEHPETDIILMDIKLPVMNGYNATREIRKFNQDVVIIAQTAFGLSGDREKAIEAGCDDYIAKPINKNLLFEKIMLHLSKK